MNAVPSRGGLTALADAAASIAPAVMVGLARPLDGGRVSLVYTHANGAGELLLEASEVPEVLQRRPSRRWRRPDRASRSVPIARPNGSWFLRVCSAWCRRLSPA